MTTRKRLIYTGLSQNSSHINGPAGTRLGPSASLPARPVRAQTSTTHPLRTSSSAAAQVTNAIHRGRRSLTVHHPESASAGYNTDRRIGHKSRPPVDTNEGVHFWHRGEDVFRGSVYGLVLTAGQAADTSFFATVLDTVSVADGSRGRPRNRPERVLADKAYTSRANRDYLTGRGIKVTIPERDDQKAGRERRATASVRQGCLQRPQRRRALFQSAQTMARHRHPER